MRRPGFGRECFSGTQPAAVTAATELVVPATAPTSSLLAQFATQDLTHKAKQAKQAKQARPAPEKDYIV